MKLQFYCLSSCSWYSGVNLPLLTRLSLLTPPSHRKSFRNMNGGETYGLSQGGSCWACACRSAHLCLQMSMLVLLAHPHHLHSSPNWMPYLFFLFHHFMTFAPLFFCLYSCQINNLLLATFSSSVSLFLCLVFLMLLPRQFWHNMALPFWYIKWDSCNSKDCLLTLWFMFITFHICYIIFDRNIVL